MMRRLSVRARITLGSAMIAAVLLALALLVVRGQVGDILSEADGALAQGDLTPFRNDITASPTAEVDDPGTGVLVFVRAPDGEVEVNTLPHDVQQRVMNRSPANELFTMSDDEGRNFIVVGRIVSTSVGDWTLWSARSTSSSELALAGLERVLIVGGLVLLIGFALASWLLATVALRPVARMRRRADSLGSAMDGDLPVGTADDELTALARTLNDLLARVRASATREKQMVSDASHELRTPLSALKTQLELAHDDVGDAAALAAHLAGAEASVDRLAALATNLLELNRLEVEGLATRTAETAELVTELMGSIDRARMLGLAKSVQVGFDLSGVDEQRRYRIDPQSFGRIADNLLSNAVNAVASDGHVEALLRQAEHGLHLTVADDGPGMPPHYLPHAVERFSRPDTARTSAAGGSGLGLALVQAIVTAAEGTMELRNREPGFLVDVSLPNM